MTHLNKHIVLLFTDFVDSNTLSTKPVKWFRRFSRCNLL